MSADTQAATAGIVPQRAEGTREKGYTLYTWFVPEEETVTRGNKMGYIAHLKGALRMKGIITGFEITSIDRVRKGNLHFIQIRIENGSSAKKTLRAIDAVRRQTTLKDNVLAYTASSTPSTRLKQVRKRQLETCSDRPETYRRSPKVQVALATGIGR